MKNLIQVFIKYPFYANIIIVILIVAGVYSATELKMSFFPERTSREILVTVAYPGASPKEMEEGVTVRIEEAIRSIVGIKEINSTSSENFARVTILTTGEYDIDVTVQEVKNAIDGISAFPVSAERPIVYKRRTLTQAMFMGLSGDEIDLKTLKSYAQEIEDDMRSSGIITQVSIGGYPDLEISVEVTEETLLRYNLTFDEISRAIALNNTDISAGMIKSDEEEVLIRSRRRSVDPNDIADIILRANPDGSFIRIRDIGEVKLKFADVAGTALMNGKPAVFFNVSKLNQEDLKEISEYCVEYAKKFNEKHEGLELYVTYNFLNMLKARLKLLYTNGGLGLLLVLVTLGLFLSLRLSFWVAFGIPASFLGMFIVANMYGVTINMISLFGMILVIGILVDDGIVIAENIYSHFEKGKSPKQAALDGTMEVLPAVSTSVTTTIIAFTPLLLIKEGGMEFLFEMAFVVIFSLAFSLIEAFFVLPGHVGNKHILRSKESKDIGMKIRNTLDVGVDFLRTKIYGKILRWMLKYKYLAATFPIALILFTFTFLNIGWIKYTFFPTIQFDSFNIDIAFTPGAGEAQTWNYLDRFDNAIWEVNKELMDEHKDNLDKLNDSIPIVRFTFPGSGSAFQGIENGAHAGNIFVLLRDLEGVGVSGFEVADRVRKKIGPIPEADKFTVGGSNRFGAPVSMSLLGKNLEELKQAELFLTKKLHEMDELINITNNNAAGKKEILLDLKPKAYFLGLDHASISNQIRQGFFGGQAQRLQKGKDELRVWVRYPREDRSNIGKLEDMKIKTPRGDYPLIELANYEIKRGPVNIQRFNMKREIRIDADLVDPYMPVPPIIEKINTQILPDLKSRYPGVEVKYQGQQRRSSEAGNEMLNYFVIAFLLIVVVLMIHFRSFSQGMIIIAMIPLAWLGAAWGHGLHGKPISMLSAWGMVALTGVIINDAVVFLSKYNLFLKEGMKVREAVYQAGLARFRAIVLTTLTTTIGLYPIILEKSFQAQFLIPMAISLAYGVLVGTGFILILFPIIILILNDFKRFIHWLWHGKWPEPEQVEKAVKYQNREIE